jgi:predicted metal-dependent enzyme (double-stranded beta helix superfamily)
MNSETQDRFISDQTALVNMLESGDSSRFQTLRVIIAEYVAAREWLEANLHLPLRTRGLMPPHAYNLYRKNRKFWHCEAKLQAMKNRS